MRGKAEKAPPPEPPPNKKRFGGGKKPFIQMAFDVEQDESFDPMQRRFCGWVDVIL